MNAIGQLSSSERLQAGISDRSRTWGWTKLIVAYGLLEAALWTPGETQKVFSLVFLAWIIATTIASRSSLKELGLGLSGLRQSMIALPLSAIAFMTMLLLAWFFGTLGPAQGARVVPHATGYIVWSFIQEFLLNSFFFLTLERLLDSRRAVTGAVLLFVLAHIPNVVLMIGTLLLSSVFVSIFRRYRNIYPLGLCHGILGLTVAVMVPERLLGHMRVGLGFIHLMVK